MSDIVQGARKRLILVDDDEDIVRFVQSALSSQYDVDGFASSKSAWDSIGGNPCDGFLIDWKMPEISGLALLNRIRQVPAHLYSPVLVMSGFLDMKDFRLLEEYPFLSLVEKPFTPVHLLTSLKEVFSEYQWFEANRDNIKEKIQNLGKDSSATVAFVQSLLARSPQHAPLALFVGQFYYEQKRYAEATQVFRAILNKAPQSYSAMTYLGKIFLEQKDFANATSMLTQAHQASPKNLERICLLGDASLNIQNFDKAQEYFEEAEKIDPTNERTQAGKELARTLADSIRALNISGSLGKLPQGFAAMMNAMAISLVRTGQFQKGIELYHAALNYVQEKPLKCRLCFNLGLGYLRWNKKQVAAYWFQKSLEYDEEGKFAKPRYYIDKLKHFQVQQPPSGGPTKSAATSGVQNEEYDFSLDKTPKKDGAFHHTEVKPDQKNQTTPKSPLNSDIFQVDLEFEDFDDESLT